jgi:hypothetical protein
MTFSRVHVVRRQLIAIVAVGVAAVLVGATPAGAHGVGGRSDLPVPLWQFVYSAASALVISFVLLRLSWHRPQLASRAAGADLKRPVQIANLVIIVVLRLLGLLLFGVTVGAAWFGSTSSRENIAPVMVFVLLWVGLQILSVIFGNVWSALSPYETLAGVAAWARTRRSQTVARARDDDSVMWSHWPAAIGIFGFVWLELAYQSPSEPRILAITMTAYSAVILALAARYGRAWLRTGEAFGVLFSTLALMAPLHRDDEGRVRVRWPFVGLSQFVPRRGSIVFISVVLGSTAFDGVQRTSWWAGIEGEATGWDRTWIATFGLVWVIGIVAAAYIAASMAAARLGGSDANDGPQRYVHSLVPLIFGYSIAHYFTLLIIEGQSAIALMSSPFGTGRDFFGTADYVVDIDVLSAGTISWIQVIAIVVGHVVGVVLAHDRAVEHHPHTVATRSQLPMLAVMVGFTMAGLTLLLKS